MSHKRLSYQILYSTNSMFNKLLKKIKNIILAISYVWHYRVKVGILKNHTYLSLKLDIILEFEFGLNRWMTVSFYSPAHRSVQMLKGQRSKVTRQAHQPYPFFHIPVLSCNNKQPDFSEHALHCHSKYS